VILLTLLLEISRLISRKLSNDRQYSKSDCVCEEFCKDPAEFKGDIERNIKS